MDAEKETRMRRGLSSEQRQRVEELVRAKQERCALCGNANLRCDDSAARYMSGGYNVRLICTNDTAAAHTGGIGLARDYSITPDEARRVGLS
jgi:hypothetical protein